METVETKTTLLDTLHRCLMCNSVAYEVADNKYKCSNRECNCTWKVTNCGQ